MKYSVCMPNFGPFSDPRYVADLARLAESAGWDGFFVWDHVTFRAAERPHVADPWILLTAVALATERIRLGTLVTPVARRRPSKLARETVTLDRLSGGRLVLGVGLGSPVEDEYGAFGDTTDLRVLADRLDEGLEVLDRLWSGEPVRYEGTQFTVRDVTFTPTPVQHPRIPVWVAGVWPHRRPMRRAARWDGVVPLASDPANPFRQPTPAELRDVVELVGAERAQAGRDGPFDVVVAGGTPGDDARAARAIVAPLADAGATWWNEGLESMSPEQVRARIRQGPPDSGEGPSSRS